MICMYWSFGSGVLCVSVKMDKKSAIRRAKRPSKVLEENYWDCSVCTYRNNAEAFKCSMCDVRKGNSPFTMPNSNFFVTLCLDFLLKNVLLNIHTYTILTNHRIFKSFFKNLHTIHVRYVIKRINYRAVTWLLLRVQCTGEIIDFMSSLDADYVATCVLIDVCIDSYHIFICIANGHQTAANSRYTCWMIDLIWRF